MNCPYCKIKLTKRGRDYTCRSCDFYMSELDVKILQTALCCACQKPVKSSEFLNYVLLDHLATWEYLTWNNILVQDIYPEMRASALVCDNCVKEKVSAKFAIEINTKPLKIQYHPLSQLEELPEMDRRILTQRGAT